MSQKTRAALTAGANSAYPDNASGAITPLDDRTQHIDEIDSALLLAETSLQTVTGLTNYTGGLQVSGVDVTASGIIFIGAASEFDVQDATTITLESGKFYWITTTISTSKRFIIENNAVLTAGSQQTNSVLTYTGTGAMFTAVDANFEISRIQYSHPNGTGFDVTDTVGGVIFAFLELVLGIAGTSIGTFSNIGALIINRSTILADDGLSVSGPDMLIFAAALTRFATTDGAAKCLDLNGAILQTIKISDVIFNYATGAHGISGLASSGNLPSGRLAMVTNCEFDDNLTPLENITNEDIRWEFSGNAQVPDTVNEADLYLTGGAETITTGSAGDWQEIGTPGAGGVSWASDIASRFTVSSSGVITYIGERDLCIRVSGRATVEKVGGGSNVIEVRLAKNWDGTASDSGIEKSRSQTENTAPTSVPIGALVGMSTNDNVRVIFSNVNGTSNIIANVSAVEVA